MFTIRCRTVTYLPEVQVTPRTNVDGWNKDLPGIDDDDEWRFEPDEARSAPRFTFKLVLERAVQMLGPNLVLAPASVKPIVTMQPNPSTDLFVAATSAFKDNLLDLLGGEALPDDDLALTPASLGGVAHEVGTRRLGANGDGVVDTDLKFLAHDNLYACDLSVFCSAPAANPTLTVTALAIRLADHLKRTLGGG